MAGGCDYGLPHSALWEGLSPPTFRSAGEHSQLSASVIERLVGKLIDHLDAKDGDPDLEGDPFNEGEPAFDEFSFTMLRAQPMVPATRSAIREAGMSRMEAS